jgi:DNA repair protein RadC
MVILRNSDMNCSNPADVAQVFQDVLTLEDSIDRDKEHFYVCHVNARQQVTLVELVAIGILDHTCIHPRETFRRAVREGAESIVVAHNHPSGDVTPSDADIKTTRALHDAGHILQIPLLDHVIFTDKHQSFFSFQDNKTQSTTDTKGEIRYEALQMRERG